MYMIDGRGVVNDSDELDRHGLHITIFHHSQHLHHHPSRADAAVTMVARPVVCCYVWLCNMLLSSLVALFQ